MGQGLRSLIVGVTLKINAGRELVYVVHSQVAAMVLPGQLCLRLSSTTLALAIVLAERLDRAIEYDGESFAMEQVAGRLEDLTEGYWSNRSRKQSGRLKQS